LAGLLRHNLVKRFLLLALLWHCPVFSQQNNSQPEVKLEAQAQLRDFDLRGDAKTLYTGVARAYGLDCVFEDDFNLDKQIRFQVQQVDYRTALHALESATGSFAVPLSSRIFLVAKDTPDKRRTFEPFIAVTIDLSEAVTPQELTESVTGVQQLLAIEKLGVQAQGNRVVLRGPASKVLAARDLLADLIRPRPEVAIEVKLLEVSKKDTLTWGVDLPTLFPIQNFNSLANVGTKLSAIARLGISQFAFGTGVMNAQLVASMEQSSGQALLNLAIRAQNHQPATFHSGDRYPVVTQQYVSGQPSTAAPSTVKNPDGSTTTTTTAPPTFGSVSQPSGVVIRDFNQDGILDLAASSAGANSVAVLLGNSNGTYQDAVLYPTGNSPAAIVAIDVNGDGFVDLVTADSASNTVSVLLGVGDGTFGTKTSYPVGSRPVALVVADFNGDGVSDLATANADSNDISILLGNKNGGFGAQTLALAGARPRSLVAVDLNGDSRVDLAAVNVDSADLSVLIGNGNGTFQDTVSYATGVAPLAIVGTDLNRDGFVDLVVANSGDDTISVFLGDGTGALAKGVAYPAGTAPVALVISDFNTDGILDVMVANPQTGGVSSLFGLGNGSFQAPVLFSTGREPDSLVTADVNKDGVADVIAGNSASNNFTLLLGTAGGGFHDPNGGTFPPTGGSTYAPIPSFNYEDLGLVVKVTPHVHGSDEATLDLTAEFKQLTGESLSGVPVIANRKLATQIRVRNDEWVVIAGLLTTSEARTLTGYPIFPFLQKHERDKDQDRVFVLIKATLLRAPAEGAILGPISLGSDTRPRIPF